MFGANSRIILMQEEFLDYFLSGSFHLGFNFLFSGLSGIQLMISWGQLF
jgi:hypothetical protein